MDAIHKQIFLKWLTDKHLWILGLKKYFNFFLLFPFNVGLTKRVINSAKQKDLHILGIA